MFNNLGPQLRALVRLATGLVATVISELFWQMLMGAKWKTIKLQGEKEMDLRKVWCKQEQIKGKGGEEEKEELSWAKRSSCGSCCWRRCLRRCIFAFVSHYSAASSQVSSVALVSVAVASFLVGFLLQVVDYNNNYMQPEALVHALNALLLSFYLSLSLFHLQLSKQQKLPQTNKQKNKRKQRRLRCDCDGANWHDKPRKKQQQSAQKHLQMLQLSSVQLQQSVI